MDQSLAFFHQGRGFFDRNELVHRKNIASVPQRTQSRDRCPEKSFLLDSYFAGG